MMSWRQSSNVASRDGEALGEALGLPLADADGEAETLALGEAEAEADGLDTPVLNTTALAAYPALEKEYVMVLVPAVASAME